VIYEYNCANGHHFERVLPVADYQTPQQCDCGAKARRIISLPAKGYVQRECCYDSPIDGRPISSWKQRRDDLARHGCQEYDPGMRQDTDRKVKRDQAQLEKAVDATVDEFVEKLPSVKREQLATEIASGAGADIVRTSV
jgi:putative FmdB family regulatory protein